MIESVNGIAPISNGRFPRLSSDEIHEPGETESSSARKQSAEISFDGSTHPTEITFLSLSARWEIVTDYRGGRMWMSMLGSSVRSCDADAS